MNSATVSGRLFYFFELDKMIVLSNKELALLEKLVVFGFQGKNKSNCNV
jgi:hypothetical protein